MRNSDINAPASKPSALVLAVRATTALVDQDGTRRLDEGSTLVMLRAGVSYTSQLVTTAIKQEPVRLDLDRRILRLKDLGELLFILNTSLPLRRDSAAVAACPLHEGVERTTKTLGSDATLYPAICIDGTQAMLLHQLRAIRARIALLSVRDISPLSLFGLSGDALNPQGESEHLKTKLEHVDIVGITIT